MKSDFRWARMTLWPFQCWLQLEINWDMECERIDNNRWFPFYLRSIHLIHKHTHTLVTASMWTPTESISWEISARTRVSIKGVTHCISIQRNCTKLPSIIIFKPLIFSLISIKWPEVIFFISILIESKYTQHEQYPSHSNRTYCFK